MSKIDMSMINNTVWNRSKLTSGKPLTDDGLHTKDALSYSVLTLTPNPVLWNGMNTNTDINHLGVMRDWFKMGFTGPITNQFNYNVTSEWVTSEVGKMISLGVEGFLAGVGELGSVRRSKQYWKNSGYLTITPEVRIVDWDGDGSVMLQALLLTSYCTSVYSDDLGGSDAVDAMTDKAEAWWEEFKNEYDVDARINGGTGTRRHTKDDKKKGINKGDLIEYEANEELQSILSSGFVTQVKRLAPEAIQQYIAIIADMANLRYSPPTLRVKWGNMFKHNDMILENLSMSFSTEQTEYGPLYMDVSLTLKSRTTIGTFSDSGLLHGVENSGGRVEFVGGATTVS